ncbi:hypothetical protein CBM2637_B140015 [Cupriavidus taiwanensis]|nr:hypothetical protein CBM2637_B140015 [Cupriavidus taiwanensis]SPA54680.1 protein of unknown function [Cupriavidus taiwanensis]
MHLWPDQPPDARQAERIRRTDAGCGPRNVVSDLRLPRADREAIHLASLRQWFCHNLTFNEHLSTRDDSIHSERC